MDISVIVPLYNETESLPELAAWIRRVMEANGFTYEILMVDDGSTDGSWDTVLSLSKENPAIHGISFRRNYGKSAALYEGFAAVEGDVVIMKMPQETVESVVTELNTAISTKMGAGYEGEIGRFVDKLPLYTFIGQWIYCFLYGSLLSGIMSRYLFMQDAFRGPDDNGGEENVDNQ